MPRNQITWIQFRHHEEHFLHITRAEIPLFAHGHGDEFYSSSSSSGRLFFDFKLETVSMENVEIVFKRHFRGRAQLQTLREDQSLRFDNGIALKKR